jgi:transposase
MTKIIYTKSQIKEIEANKYVEKCTPKQIRLTNEFKVELLKIGDKWVFYREIFDILWFPEYVTKSKIPERTYTRYKNIKKTNWLIWLIWTKKWRPIKEKIDINKMNLKEQNEYFKTENAYLKELHKTAYWHYP